MSISYKDYQRVFLTYRAVFIRETAHIRKQKKIKQLVYSHQKTSKSLIQSMGIDHLVRILKTLLERGLFESEKKAKAAFPELFKTSAVHDAARMAGEAGAAKEEARALGKVECLDSANGDGRHDDGGDVEHKQEQKDTPEAAVAAAGTTGGIHVPSLYPAYIPYREQHSILTKTQGLLEECCFEFTSKWAPSMLTENGWDCPEAIELNRWTLAIIKHLGTLSADALDNKFKSSTLSIFTSVNQLRHSAVHRLHISTTGIEQMIYDAVAFAGTLGDTVREGQLAELHAELKSLIRSQELHKNFLETRLQEELDEIRRLREELNKREEQAVDTMVKEDAENKFLVGSLLAESLKSAFDKTKADEPNDTNDTTSSEEQDAGFTSEEGQTNRGVQEDSGSEKMLEVEEKAVEEPAPEPAYKGQDETPGLEQNLPEEPPIPEEILDTLSETQQPTSDACEEMVHEPQPSEQKLGEEPLNSEEPVNNQDDDMPAVEDEDEDEDEVYYTLAEEEPQTKIEKEEGEEKEGAVEALLSDDMRLANRTNGTTLASPPPDWRKRIKKEEIFRF